MLSTFSGIVDEVLSRIDFATVQIDQANSEMIGCREFNVLFVDSFKAFKHINPAKKTSTYDFNEYYLIFLKVNSIQHYSPYKDLLKILIYCWKHYIINVSIIVEYSSGVSHLYTYFPFSNNRCRNTEPILINQFENGVSTNGTDFIFPNKLQNLQGCSLVAALWDGPPFLRIMPDRTGLDKFIDFEGVLLKVIARKMNFDLDYIIPPNNEQRGKRFPNGSTNGAMKLLEARTADLSLGSFRYTMERADVMTPALPYYQNWQVFGVLKTSSPYTPIEILIFPFATSAWLSMLAFVGVIMSFGILVITYYEVIGRLFLELSANHLVASFLGASMSNLPHGNFIRYLLILWVIFAFIMRSAYQSLLFKLLQSSLYRNPPNSLRELEAQGYTLVMNQGTFETVNTMLKIQSGNVRYIVMKNSSDLNTFDFIENTTGKFAGISPMDFLVYYAMTKSRRGVFHILPEKISAQHITLYFSKHSYLIERFNIILMNLRAAGLIDLWASQNLDVTYFDTMKHGYIKEPLKLDQLRGTFDVYLVLVVVASLVFFLELLSRRVKWIKSSLKFVCSLKMSTYIVNMILALFLQTETNLMRPIKLHLIRIDKKTRREMSTTAEMKAMLSKTVIILYLYGFQLVFSYKFGLDFLHSHKELSNKTDFICRSHFTNRVTSITISAEVETIQAWHMFNDFAGNLLQTIEFLKVQLETFGYHDSKLWDYFNIIYVDSESSFRRINTGEKTKHQDYSEYYLVIYEALNYENQLEEIEAIFAYCWSYYIVNVSVMLEDSMGMVRMFTYFPFNENKCFSTSVTEITGSEFYEIFPPKMHNLHQCELIGAFWIAPPYVTWNISSTSLDRFNGMEGDILRNVAINMNFSLEVIIPPNDERRGLIYKNGTVTGAVKMLQEREAHFSLGCFRCTQERATILSASYSYYQTDQIFFVNAHSALWTTFEIMAYPFDVYIWTTMLTIIITTILLSIFLEKYQPSILFFIFGSDSGNSFNIISVWLGQPVIPEPKRNFARFILTLWMLTSLILRNAYQGLLFNFLTSNFYKIPPDTAMQLAEQNYILVVSYSSNDTLSQLPIIRKGLLRLKVEKLSENENLNIFDNTNSKIASTLPKDFLSYYVGNTRNYGKFHVLKETVFTHQMCVYFTKHSFLTPRFNEILKSFRSFGLIDLWASKNLANELIELKPSGHIRELSLGMHQLDGAFIMLVVFLFVAVLVFTLELMSPKYPFLQQCFEYRDLKRI